MAMLPEQSFKLVGEDAVTGVTKPPLGEDQIGLEQTVGLE